MYTQYFGLHEKPFAIAPSPRYLYMSELHREALAHLLYGIDSDGCIILLTGDVGTGKTTVCRFFLEQLPATTDCAIILNPKLSAIELLQTICDELEITTDGDDGSSKTYIDAINHYLLRSHGQGRTTVLIIDEAQNLSVGVLEQLRLLTNLETDKSKLLKIVLLGQSELREKLEHPEATQINQRVTSRYHLQPLSKNDVFAYIQHRLEVAGGGKNDFFTQGALNRIFHLSKGIPRLINMICDRSLLGAYSENKIRADKSTVKRAAFEVLGKSGYTQANRGIFNIFNSKHAPLAFLILFVLTISLSLVFLYRQELTPQEDSAISERSPKETLPSFNQEPAHGVNNPDTISLSKKMPDSTDSPDTTAEDSDTTEETTITIAPAQVL